MPVALPPCSWHTEFSDFFHAGDGELVDIGLVLEVVLVNFDDVVVVLIQAYDEVFWRGSYAVIRRKIPNVVVMEKAE